MISSHQLLQFSQASSNVYTGWNRFSVDSAVAHPGNATITTVGHFCSALCQSLSNKILGGCWSFSICNMTINIFNSSGHENFVSDQGLECTLDSTSSPRLNFSGCHPDDIVQNKEFFIANLAIVILIGAPANLVTLMALPYVRLR